MSDEERDDLERSGLTSEPYSAGEDLSNETSGHAGLKKVVFDDFQITRAEQQAQVDEERQAWHDREERIEKEKPSLIRFAVPRLKSLRDEMIGVQNKIPFFRKHTREEEEASPMTDQAPAMRPVLDDQTNADGTYFAEHERAFIRVTRVQRDGGDQRTPVDPPIAHPVEGISEFRRNAFTTDPETSYEEPEVYEEPETEEAAESEMEEEAVEYLDTEETAEEESAPVFEIPVYASTSIHALDEEDVPLEPKIEPSLKSFLDALRAFDSYPRRSYEPRDPRADFVTLLAELLDILRDELNASSAMFFWVNTKKQQLVLESAALDDHAYQFLAASKRFPIELDAVSRIVTKRRPELHASISPQAELDLIPYYRDAIGIASFAGMPVLFGDGLVAVLTVDSTTPDHYSAETLRILTNHSKLISGLIRSYIEKYDLLAAARTLDAARKLHEMVSPDGSLRALRDQRKNPEYVLRALTEAAGEIIDWEWLAAASFDDSRRLWIISSLQSKRTGGYVPPMTPVSMEESLIGKCLASGRSLRVDELSAQTIRFNVEEDCRNAAGHSFLVIPIRTATKNYGALAIEHTERARYTDADVETLEHLARSAAAALEIIVLGDMVGERALTDLLTGVLNKHGLLDRTNQELARAMQFDEPLTFVLFEIDGASEFRSRFSQEDSDTIVLAIARLLRFGVRPFDVVARIEEHTFAVLLMKRTDEEGYLWSEKMRKMIVSEVIAIGKRSYSVTASIGVSGARREGTAEELIDGAERALERARELGGNNVIVY
jgi:diguanylate cyclase (GGDEF)-like protein